MFNIITERFVRITLADGVRSASLPEVFAALMRDEVETFSALRPHQRHAWHAFLVQLGAMAMHRAGVSEPPENAEEWADLIRRLTPDHPDDEPWQLVVEDLTKPAFMQPPASSTDKEKEFKNTVETPDGLDMLVTAKNHDLKSSLATGASVDDWLFALVTLQTASAQDGRGNYFVSRIKSAYSGRPAFSLTPTGRLGSHVFRDISVLVDKYPLTDRTKGLLWTIPWDGKEPEKLLLDQTDPFYVEISRRIRLRADRDGNLYGIRANSQAARIETKMLKGRTGDPWTPINKITGEALNVGPAGFTYKRITEYLLSSDWEWPTLLSPTPKERRERDQLQLVARSLKRNTRKQGMTEGYDERVIPLRPAATRVFGRPAEMQELGDIARERIEQVAIVQRILSHAIQTFAARGDSDKISPEHRKLARPWLNQLDAVVDTRFFDDLQTEFESGDRDERQRIRNEWLLNSVVKEAQQILHDATGTFPCPTIHRYRARVSAEGLFEGRICGSKGLPFLFDEDRKEN